MRVWLVYIRKSVVRTETDLESPERQLHVCKTLLELSETQPYTTELYQDLDRSGSSEAGRDDWLKLKDQLDRPEVVGVAAYSLDRLYRNVSEFLNFLNGIEQRGKVLRTAKENLDTSGPLGRFVVTILMALYEMEWRLTSARMVDMIDHKRRMQGRHWGVAPFGCDRDNDGQLVPSQKTYFVNGETRYYHDGLIQCYHLYASGHFGYDQVAGLLNVAGWRFWQPLKQQDQKSEYLPVEWDMERVRGVINRWRLYRGDLPLGNPLKSSNLEWLSGGHQPVIPIELCDSVGTALGQRSQRSWNRHKSRTYMLSDFIHCHKCGARMAGQFYKRRMYRHHFGKGECTEAWISADDLESEVMAAIGELVHQPDLFDDIYSTISEPDPTNDQTLQKKITDVCQQLNRLEDLYVTENGISKPSYLTRRQELLNDLAELEAQQGQQNVSITEIMEQVLAGLSYLEEAEEKTKKALISNVIERLEVSNGKIQSITPQPWATPFFDAICAVYGPGGSRALLAQRLLIVDWLNNLSSYQHADASV